MTATDVLPTLTCPDCETVHSLGLFQALRPELLAFATLTCECGREFDGRYITCRAQVPSIQLPGEEDGGSEATAPGLDDWAILRRATDLFAQAIALHAARWVWRWTDRVERLVARVSGVAVRVRSWTR